MRIREAGHYRATAKIDNLCSVKFFRVVIRANENDSSIFDGYGFCVRLVIVNRVNIPRCKKDIHLFGIHNSPNK